MEASIDLFPWFVSRYQSKDRIPQLAILVSLPIGISYYHERVDSGRMKIDGQVIGLAKKYIESIILKGPLKKY